MKRYNVYTIKYVLFLQTQPEILRLDLVLRWVAKYIDGMPKDQTILVDWMPNLKFLISAATFVKECNNEFRFFEEKVLQINGLLI